MAKYDGLLHTPATDLNFISGIKRLKDAVLSEMLDKLYELNKSEGGHKGRIKAVEKEMNSRGENSTDMIAVNKMQADIETVERLYSDGMPYELDRIENEIRFYMAQTAQALFESGKRCLRIKAHEDHGDFMASLERIKIPIRMAEYAMAVVVKFGPNSQPVANLGSTKLLMLTVFEEDDIKKYVNGGPLGNIPHDDVETMTKRELQEAIRKEREKHKRDVETREKAVKQKEAKINELDELLRYQQPLSEQEKIEKAVDAELEKLRQKLFTNIQLARFYFGETLETIATARHLEGVTFPQLEKWAKAHYEELADFQNLFDALDDDLNYIHTDKGDVE
jgi:succinate dehydrogenase flavin-adding protein (antitoxin of CptAB toxin-antitoxin module)